MSSDAQIVLLVGGLHLIGLIGAGLLLLQCLRGETVEEWTPRGEDDDGGGNDRRPPARPWRPPGGGTPLPDAVQARVRLREPGLLGELLPRRERRPLADPAPAGPGRRRVHGARD